MAIEIIHNIVPAPIRWRRDAMAAQTRPEHRSRAPPSVSHVRQPLSPHTAFHGSVGHRRCVPRCWQIRTPQLPACLDVKGANMWIKSGSRDKHQVSRGYDRSAETDRAGWAIRSGEVERAQRNLPTDRPTHQIHRSERAPRRGYTGQIAAARTTGAGTSHRALPIAAHILHALTIRS